MENNVPEKQVIEELDQIQKQLMKKYGSGGVANEKLQDELREYGRKGDGYWDARKLLEGALIYNRMRSEDPERQKLSMKYSAGIRRLALLYPASEILKREDGERGSFWD